MEDLQLVAVVGPTAAGKSALALRLARALDGEIVNADSMQLYRGMDIGTAKPTAAERATVPHHVYDLWQVTEPASVAVYQQAALAAAAAIRARGRVPVLVGGSGLYVRAVVDRIDFPGTDDALRADLLAELDRVGPETLHKRLSRVDPAAAAAILPTNGRRIARALEVVQLSGRPFSASLPRYDAVPGCVQLGLDRVDLDARADARVDAMWEQGLVAEVRTLLDEGLREGPTARRALGYAQVLAHFDGTLTEAEAQEETRRATRRFVRRQRSWFRRDPRIDWLDAAAPTLLDDALRRTLAR